jgi:hypothetical protein|tara:strand:+ start:1442 stop:1885 length:444 start_codon:yes stop_codon:yes gene_type:complete
MMKNFDSILTDCLLEKGLKYIRFKVDPTINKGFEADKGYEGFVLQELSLEACGGPMGLPPILKVLMPGGDMPGIFDVKKPVITPSKPRAVKIFKKFISKMLKEKVGKKEMHQIQKSNNINDIEQYLKQSGLDDKDLLDLYKKVLKNA